eukprot:symbB.v1.2.011729.t1/scaffold699.1/size171451/6
MKFDFLKEDRLICEDKRFLYVVMERVKGGELFEALKSELAVIIEQDVARVGLQLMKALDYIHGCNIVHRDIKAQNILLSEPPILPGRALLNADIKLIDFGLSAKLPRECWRQQDRAFDTICGTPACCAPEIWATQEKAIPLWRKRSFRIQYDLNSRVSFDHARMFVAFFFWTHRVASFTFPLGSIRMASSAANSRGKDDRGPGQRNQPIPPTVVVQCCAGSMGHPELCRAPCVHMLKNGSCHLGFACDFCHFMHRKKKKLDKSQRNLLIEAEPGQRLAMVLPHIIEKLKVLDDPETAKLIPSLEAQLQLALSVDNPNSLPAPTADSDGQSEAEQGQVRHGVRRPTCFQARSRKVQIHRNLQRMNVNALFDLIAGSLPEHLLHVFADMRKGMIPRPKHGEWMILPEGMVIKFWL